MLYVDLDTPHADFERYRKKLKEEEEKKLKEEAMAQAERERPQREYEEGVAECVRWLNIVGQKPFVYEYCLSPMNAVKRRVAVELVRRFQDTLNITEYINVDIPDDDGPYGFVRRYMVMTFSTKVAPVLCSHCGGTGNEPVKTEK